MKIKILKSSKTELEVELDNITIVEIVKVYLNKDPAVLMAAWRQEHPLKNPVLRVETKGEDAKKAVKRAITKITEELDKIDSDFKNLKI